MVIHMVRATFLLVVMALTISFTGSYLKNAGEKTVILYLVAPALAAVILVLADTCWKSKPLKMLSGLFFGVLSGMVISYVLGLIIDMALAFSGPVVTVAHPGPRPIGPSPPPASAPVDVENEYVRDRARYLRDNSDWQVRLNDYLVYEAHVKSIELVKLLVGAGVIFLCVSFVLQTKDDFRFVIPYVEFAKATKGARPMLLDTSVIIDGRIADIAETGILESEILVPRFILSELQAIADSEDKLKRNRGRRGLDILNRLQGSKKMEIRITDPHVAEVDSAPDVDGKLLALAKHSDARVMTNDYNLNKVAKVRGVDVVNINELANALKPAALPGEKMAVRVVKAGEEAGQGVGYLADGTMVVAEGGRDKIGQDVMIIVTSVLQTSAGRMIFGRFEGERTAGPHK
jgi:rRNA-processing protein FCF1